MKNVIKNILALYFICLMTNVSRAQNYLKANENYWFASFINIRTDGLPVVRQTDPGSSLEGLDNDGNILWTKTSGMQLLRPFMFDDNSQLAFYTDYSNLYIERMSETGGTLWTTSYSASELGYDDHIDSVYDMNPVSRNSDGEYAVLLNYDWGTCGEYRKFNITRFDSMGILINQFPLCPGDYTLDEDMWMEYFHIMSSSDHISFVSSQYTEFPYFEDAYVSIINVDETGAFISQKNYKDFCLLGAKQLSDGYLMYGWYQDDASPMIQDYAGYYFMRTDFYGDTLWVDRHPATDRIYVEQATLTEAGNVITVLRNNDDDKLFLQKSNSGGEVLWNSYLTFSDYYANAYDLKAISDSRFAIAGYFYDIYSGHHSYLFVTDSTAYFPQVDVRGTVYYDENDNNEYDASEVGLSGQHLISSVDGSITHNSSVMGEYGFSAYEDISEINISLSTSPLFVQSFPLSGEPITVTPDLSSGYYLQENADFAVQFVTEGLNLKTDIYAGNIAPGFDNWDYVTITNTGSVSVDEGTVTLSHPSDLTLLGSDPPYSFYTDTTITWTFHNLDVFESRWMEVFFTADLSTDIGVDLQFTSIIEPVADDIISSDNYDTTKVTTTASLDPNHKAVYPTGEGEEKNIDVNTSALEYEIGFQNTGTGETHFIVITDTLSEYLDINSIEMQASSDPYTIEITRPNIVRWIFNDIHLTPSTTDFDGSMGFLKFSIAINDTADVGDVIENKAYIYFDYNPAIITNTVKNTLKNMPQEISPELNITGASIAYPNPADELITIELDQLNAGDLNANIYDVTGNEMFAGKIPEGTSSLTINVKNFSSGLYTYILSDSRNKNFSSGKFEIKN